MSNSTNGAAPHIPVDFGNCDADGAVRLVTRVKEGLAVLLTDGELNATARVTMRDGMWVAVIVAWLDDAELQDR